MVTLEIGLGWHVRFEPQLKKEFLANGPALLYTYIVLHMVSPGQFVQFDFSP